MSYTSIGVQFKFKKRAVQQVISLSHLLVTLIETCTKISMSFIYICAKENLYQCINKVFSSAIYVLRRIGSLLTK